MPIPYNKLVLLCSGGFKFQWQQKYNFFPCLFYAISITIFSTSCRACQWHRKEKIFYNLVITTNLVPVNSFFQKSRLILVDTRSNYLKPPSYLFHLFLTQNHRNIFCALQVSMPDIFFKTRNTTSTQEKHICPLPTPRRFPDSSRIFRIDGDLTRLAGEARVY